MSETDDGFLGKANESLVGASSEYTNGRYNNCANRAYYAAFQAAIAALELAGIDPPDRKRDWSHSFVQAQFGGKLVKRQKRYPAESRDVLSRAQTLRNQADYSTIAVGQIQAKRMLDHVERFVAAISTQITGERS